VLVAFQALAAESVITNSVMIDEFAHLPAGVAYLQRGLFAMYDENPPLARYLIALPATVSGARMDYSHAGMTRRWEWGVAHDFRKINAARYFALFTWGRYVVVGLSVICGALIFRWTKSLYGTAAALVCAALWFTDPNVLAHSTIATTDIAASLFGLLATYWYFGFLRRPTSSSACVSGLGLGLAIATKFSMLVLLPAWVLMAFCQIRSSGDSSAKPTWRTGARAAVMAAIALLTINSLYGFRGTLTPLGSFTFISPLLSGSPASQSGEFVGNRFQGTWLSSLPIPLPIDFVIGFDSQLEDQQLGRPANLSADQLVAGGFWYSPLRTMFYKLPLGSLVLILLALGYAVPDLLRLRGSDCMPWIPAMLLMGFLCSQTGGLNFVFRYALPVLPFLLIGVGKLVAILWQHRFGKVLIFASVLCNILALLSIRPSYISFGNELAGGSDGARRMFLGSNYDWGQDLFRLVRWAQANPELRPLSVVYYGPIDPAETGLATSLPPAALFRNPRDVPAEGPTGVFYLAISSNGLHGLPCQFAGASASRQLQIVQSPHLTPEKAVARVGRTIYIFRIEPPGTSQDDNRLTIEMLKGCIKDIEPGDLISTP
jgi:hypothetical protein